MKPVSGLFLFFVGMVSMTQINLGGKIAFAELFFVILAPYLYIRYHYSLKKDGFSVVLWLACLWLLGACLSDYINNINIKYSIKGIATPIVYLCSIVGLYVLLRENLHKAKWLFVGMCVSGIISIFIFQRGSSGDLASEHGWFAGMQSVVSYKLFWVTKISNLLTLPIEGWYFNIPMIYTLIAMGVVAVVALRSGGRSAFLISLLSFFILLLGGKSVRKISNIRKHLWLFLVVAITIIWVARFCYQYTLKHGYLGEEEVSKYERQVIKSRSGESFLGILMGGRSDFFIGMMAALDRPLIGHGSWALDFDGYKARFISKYGSEEDLKAYLYLSQNGSIITIIPAHSHIVCAWMWHGIFGLLFWLYVLFLLGSTLIRRIDTYPPLYGYFAVMLPMAFWDLFFSPNDRRFATSVLIVICLLIRRMDQVGKGNCQMLKRRGI